MPIYVIQPLAHDEAGKPLRPRLVRAPNQAQALRHVTADSFDIEVATTSDMARLMPDGVKVENTGAAALADAAQRDQQQLPT